MIQRERYLRIGCGPKYDNSDPVTDALLDKTVYHLFHGLNARYTFTGRRDEVRRFHGLRDIESEHKIASGLDLLNGPFNEDGPGEGKYSEAPTDRCKDLL